jgi:hypothetical protein
MHPVRTPKTAVILKVAAILKQAVILSEAFYSGAEGPAFPSRTSVKKF